VVISLLEKGGELSGSMLWLLFLLVAVAVVVLGIGRGGVIGLIGYAEEEGITNGCVVDET
jgi:hypothetical protein